MFKERKTRRGFTLAEVLIVVAIVAILLAVAIPNVIGYYRSLKLTELDDSARTIFVAAQNRLTAMKNMGADLSALGSDTIEAKLTTGGMAKVSTVTETDKLASLVPGGSVDSKLHDNYYVVEIDPKTGAVIAVWYWEKESFDYATQAYSTVDPDKTKRLEKAQMVGYYGGTKVDRLEFGQMPFPAVNVVNAEELRVEIDGPTIDFSSVGSVTGFTANNVLVDVLVNGVEIVKDDNLYPAGATAITGTVVLDTLKTDTYKNNYTEGAGPGIEGNKPTDGTNSWTYGMQYKKWVDKLKTAGKDLPEPGEELTVVVRLHYDGKVKIDGEDTSLMPQTVTVRCNSLFDSVDETTGTANIAYGRHLQNLDTATSGVTGITGAKQIRDINFAATVKNTTDTAIYYWGSTYPAQDESYENGQDGFRDFQEIINNKLTEYDGQDHEIRNMYIVAETGYGGLFSMVMGGSYHNITIVNPHVHEAPDPDPTTNPGASVGALIGMAYGNVEIRECKVYVDYDPEKDTPELKKQFDRVLAQKLDNMKIDTTPKGNCYVEALLGFPHIEGAEPNSSAGGLVGWSVGNISIQNSFCSIPVVGYTNAGGLVGLASNISISESYSASFVYGCTYVGGLVGFANDIDKMIEINNCYAAGEIMNGNPSSFNGAGLVNIGENTLKEPDKIVVNTNYSAVKFVNATGAPKTGSGEEKQGTVYGTYKGDDSSANYYIPDPAVTKGYGNQASGDFVPCGEKVTTADLLEKFKGKPGWTAGAGKAHPYRLLTELDGLPEVYPYPMLTDKPHYGDWLEDSPAAQSFGYYDNCNGVFGFWGYIVDAAGGTPVFANSLAIGTTGPSGTYATDDGYCIPVEADTTPQPTVTVDTKEYYLSTDPVAENVSISVGGTTNLYDLYKVEGLFDTTNGVDINGDYYHSVTVGTTEYWFNPFFACEVIEATGTPTKPSDPVEKTFGATTYDDKPVFIRTARQLANLAAATGPNYGSGVDARTFSYVQLQNIDYDKYTGTDLTVGKTATDCQTPASLNNNGSYDGGGFFIRNLYLGKSNGSDAGTGLFGRTNGTLKNIKLVNVSVTDADSTNQGYVGALAGRYQGKEITNCGVYVDSNNLPTGFTGNAYDTFMVSGSADRVGGLIGNINSEAKLTDCFAAVKVSSTGNQIGGLVGNIATSNNSVTLVDCYSGGHTESGLYADANVTGAEQVGGLIGGVSGDNDDHAVTLSGVNYSTCSVRMTSTSNTDRIGLFVGYVSDSIVAKGTTATDIAYATGVPYNSTGTPRTDENYLTSYATNLADILAATNVGKTAGSTTKYDGSLGNSYPYLSADGMTHYGDWPELQEAVFYWEQEGSGTGVATKDAATGKYSGEGYHFYAQGYLNGQQVSLNTLCEAYHELDAAMDGNATSNSTWGYGLYGRTSDQVPTTPSGATTATNNDAETGLKKLLSLDASSVGAGTGASVTMLSGGTADKACSTASKVGTSQTYNLNLGFGAAIEVGTNSTMGQTGNPYQIRNVQQLDNIQNVSSTYKQTHDLYAGTSYTTNYTSASGFVGTYNGQSYRILELSMTNGLFTSINGNATLDSIILYSPSGSATVSGSGATGGLAGSATGSGSAKITNCVVAGYKMNSGNPLGGLVGTVSDRNNLTINFCEAVNTLSGSGVNGGLVGTASANVNINNSYAGGEITRTGFSGGIVGNLSTSASVSYTNVYSYMSMNSVSGSYLYAIGPAGNTWYGGHNNCWYWTGGITGNMYNVQDRDDSGVNAAVTLNQLKNCISGTGIGTVSDEEHTFIPSNVTGLTGPYPYPAVVKDHDGDYVHYGDWKED